MSQATNDYLLEILGPQGFALGEDIYLLTGSGTTIGAAYPIKSAAHHILGNTNSVASASLALKSMLSNDCPQIVWLVNDSPVTVVVFPFKNAATGATDTTETINGVQTGFSLTTLNSAVFVASLIQAKRKGGASAGSLNWSAALLT